MAKGDLLTLLKSDEKCKIGVNEMISMSKQVASGMAYLEEKKIVHRDLALRNILVSTITDNHYCIKVEKFSH